jgi:PAS domain S-box-containing protein
MSIKQNNKSGKDNRAHKQSESERKYRLIAENAADYVATMDFHGIYTYLSPSHKKLGYHEEDLLGKCGFDFIHPEDNIKLFPLFARYTGMKIQQLMGLKKDIYSQALSFRFPDTEGKWHHMEATASLIDSPAGKELNVLLVSRDVTERHLMEDQLKESEERYRALIELGTEAGEAIIMLQDINGEEGIQTFVNDHWTVITGYAREDLLGVSFFSLVSNNDRPASIERHRQRILGKALPGMFEMNIVRKDGTEIPVEFTGASTTYQGKRANELYLRDISTRKRHEQKLRQTEEHFSSLYDEVPIAIWDLDYSETRKYIDRLREKGITDFRRYFDDNPDEILHCLMLEGGRNPYINKAAVTLWEADSIEQLKKGIFNLINKRPAGLSYDKENIIAMIEGKYENSYDCYDLTFKDNWKHLHAIWRVAPGHERDWSRIYHLFYDVTEHKQAEEEILRLNRLYGVVSHINQTVVRVSKKEEMLDAVCRIIIEQGGFKLAWIGQIEPESKRVHPVSADGIAKDYINNIVVYTDENSPEGQGPIGRCIRKLKPIIQNDFINDSNTRPWHKKAMAFGFHGVAAFPISAEGQVWGALTVYSDTTGYFGSREVKLLEEVAGDIGFALDNYEKEEQRRQAEDAVRLNEARLESLLKISEYRANSPQELLDFALDEAIKLTSSQIGYIFHYDESKQEFVLNSWSKNAMKACNAANVQTVYHLENTGIWGEAVRQRRAILVNDFQPPNPLKKGDFEESVKILRYLSVPVLIQDKIVATVGVANKETEYTAADIRQLSLLMDSVWKVVDRMKAESQIKASLIEKELLLKEIHHRVKNNMQVISSLLELQSGFVMDKTDALMFQESQQRINSMSLVYNKLYQSRDLANISFAEYVNSLVANLMESYSLNEDRITARINIREIEIEIDLAIPCGLIINEAITNSLKYAFPDNRQGNIWIDIQQKGKQITMVLGDNGIGIPSNIDFINTKTLGMTLIQMLVIQQLGGKIELKRDCGTEYIIRFIR